MATWRNHRLISTCPECEQGKIRLARAGQRTKPENRVYHCPKCGAVFTHEEITINYPRGNMRPKLEVVISFGGWLKVKPLGHISEDYV